jgi:hypothetical protein
MLWNKLYLVVSFGTFLVNLNDFSPLSHKLFPGGFLLAEIVLLFVAYIVNYNKFTIPFSCNL